MTHSYGNGRRLDDGKALGDLDFQVRNKFSKRKPLVGSMLMFSQMIFKCRLEITWMWPFYNIEDDIINGVFSMVGS